MRRVLSAVIAALFLCVPIAAHAAGRVIVYPGQNPLSEQQNQQQRFHRLAVGTWIWNALGSNTAAGGVYANLSVVPNGGMYVAVQPTQANTLGSLYQIGVDDSATVPSGSSWTPNIAADSTQIVLQGLQSSPSGSLGPIVAPSSGLLQYYLVEAQLQTVDTDSQTISFINSNRTPSTRTVNTERMDEIVYQLKAGMAAASPTVPTVDTGWIPIATVLVPSGVSSITTGMVAAEPAFQGFIATGSNVSLAGLTLSTQSAGCLQVDSSHVVSSQPCTSGLGTVTGTSPINATTSAGVSTVTCTTCVTNVTATGNLSSTGGTTPQVKMTAAPSFTSVTASTATVNGNATIPNSGTATASANYGSQGAFQAQSSLWNGTSAVLHTWGVQTDTSGNLLFQWDAVPKLTLDSSGNLTATSFIGSGSGLTNLPLNQFSGLTANTCVRASSATTIASAAADCVTGLTPGSGIAVGTGTTPSVSIANNGVTQAQVLNGYIDLSSAQTVGGNKTFLNTLTFNNAPSSSNGYLSGSSTYGPTSATIAGPLSATTVAYTLPMGTSPFNSFTWVCGFAGGCGFQANTLACVQGVTCNLFDFQTVSSTNLIGADTSGNLGVRGNVTAANFFNGSRREWKFDIHPLNFDAVGVLKNLDLVSYRYKPDHGNPNDWKIGYIANDAPVMLSGQKHDHFDAGALATVDAKAILQLSHRVDGLEAMVKRLCRQKKNRREAVCRAFAH